MVEHHLRAMVRLQVVAAHLLAVMVHPQAVDHSAVAALVAVLHQAAMVHPIPEVVDLAVVVEAEVATQVLR